ncbi:Uncharacterised protein [Vibrio cholerae]|nr:Uncharacterised protein [Vibrio cholerae]
MSPSPDQSALSQKQSRPIDGQTAPLVRRFSTSGSVL